MLERVIIVMEINKCFIIDFYRIIKLILLIDLFLLKVILFEFYMLY